MRNNLPLLSLIFFTLWSTLWAQEPGAVGTETVTVVKPYSPTISEAFKIKTTPTLEDSTVLQKKKIQYNIFSVPVASTFTPAKGNPSPVKRTPPPTVYNSYASVGLGNYNNTLVDFYTSREAHRGEHLLDVGVNHYSSRGDIDDTPLDTDFYRTQLNVTYAQNHRDGDKDWGANVGIQHQLYNWYGIENGVFNGATLAGIDEQQHYFNAQAQAHLNLEGSFFKKGTLLVRRFWDGVESGENRAILRPTLELPFTEMPFTLKIPVDVVQGNFKNASLANPVNTTGIRYGQLQVGLHPNLFIVRDALTLNVGVKGVYALDTEANNGHVYFYPAVTASYNVLDDSLIAYGGLEGTLQQHTYYDFVQQNPYVSPTLTIQPTNQQYNGYIGVKGQLFPYVGYSLKGVYRLENRKPLFLLNPQNLLRDDEKGYTFGNSFQVVYDDVETLGAVVEVNLSVHQNVTLSLTAEFYNYTTETGDPAWNLPAVQSTLLFDYQISPQWYCGVQVFYVGQRKDLKAQVVQNVLPSVLPLTQITLDPFLDANVQAGYRIGEQLSVFVKASNLANNSYQRWANFRVQGFQLLAGVSYQFDL